MHYVNLVGFVAESHVEYMNFRDYVTLQFSEAEKRHARAKEMLAVVHDIGQVSTKVPFMYPKV
jgi:hypothetical protein